MEKRLIYIVEDDEGIQEVYKGAFDGLYDIEIFDNGEDFLKKFEKIKPELIILDIMLPNMDGFQILTKIREVDNLLPVIIVSAKSDELSSVRGLNKGADDYISKPFSIMEMLARVKTNLRRSSTVKKDIGDFIIDKDKYQISYMDNVLNLTPKEFLLLKLLLENRGITLNRERIFKEVWGEDFFGETRTLDLHISQIREILNNIGLGDNLITVRGIGYRLE